MNPVEYRQYVKSLKVGKRLPDAVYLHQSVYEIIPALYQFINHSVLQAGIEELSWNIIKLFKKKSKFLFLAIPLFSQNHTRPLP